jgi:hypothetical protein
MEFGADECPASWNSHAAIEFNAFQLCIVSARPKRGALRLTTKIIDVSIIVGRYVPLPLVDVALFHDLASQIFYA